MSDFDQKIKKIAAARIAGAQAEQALYQAKLQAQKDGLAGLPASKGALITANETARKKLYDAVKDLVGAPDAHKSLTPNLDADLPLLLLPLRIETRFIPKPGAVPGRDGTVPQQLLVRIMPDDIHVNTHEPLLTTGEITLGEQYWKALAAANRLTGKAEQLSRKQAAWQDLRQHAGRQRCIYVASQTQPTNWKSDFALADTALKFPKHTDTKTHAWTRAPHTQLLPDKFIVTIHGDKDLAFSYEGAPIPDTIYLGPDPFHADKAFEKLDGNIVPHDDIAWITDFQKAEQKGMALRIDVKPEFFQAGTNTIRKVTAAGLLFSADPEQSRALVTQMIENHYFSNNGFSLLPQGTATNNTEKDGSGYTRNEDEQEDGYYDSGRQAATLFATDPDCEGKRLADLLGIDPGILPEVPNAEMREQAEARAMNAALYPATLGYYFDVAWSPVITPAGAAQVREFFQRYVTARGPLPAIRIGDQPYGILLTSNERAWEPAEAGFHTTLKKVLGAFQDTWNGILKSGSKIAHAGMSTANSADTLVRIMGLQAGSVAFSQRPGTTLDVYIASKYNPLQAEEIGYLDGIRTKQDIIANWLEKNHFGNLNAGPNLFPPVAGLAFLKDVVSLPDKSIVIDPKSKTPDAGYIKWLAGEVATLDALEEQNLAGGGKAPHNLLYLMLRHALLLEMLRQTVQYYQRGGLTIHPGMFGKGFINADSSNPDLTAWELLHGKPGSLNLSQFPEAEPIGDLLLKKDNTIPEAAAIAELRKNFTLLKDLPPERLERYLANHLDLGFYRLDAWQSGMFYQKLEQRRAAKPKGLYIGAYGWVLDLQPTPPAPLDANKIPEKLRPQNGEAAFKLPQNAGLVHTPSLNHAASTGVLLSGHYNYGINYPSSSGGPFAVNLSSERVRRAMFIFEGVQNGQPLDALLGYQLERGLRDQTSQGNNLNQYLLQLREKYPVIRNVVPQQGSAAVQESAPVYPVVNGLKFLEDDDTFISGLPGISAGLLKQLKVEKDALKNTLDAANDLLMAETAHQATQGNNDRTAAVLNAMRNADLPPSLEVVKTPRSSRFTFMNRAAVHFRTDMSGQAGQKWTTKMSPRSIMESGLNRWIGKCIGDPGTVLCRAAHLVQEGDNQVEKTPKIISLDELQLQPIDFVLIAGGDFESSATELEGRIAYAYRKKAVTEPEDARISITMSDASGNPLARSFAQIIPLARALRTLITTARPASARDFGGRPRDVISKGSSLFNWDVVDMENRVEAAFDSLKQKIFYIEGKAPNENDPEAPPTFKDLFDGFYNSGKDPGHFDVMDLSENGLKKVLTFLRDASAFGINLAYPDDRSGLLQSDLLAKAASVLQLLRGKVEVVEVIEGLRKKEKEAEEDAKKMGKPIPQTDPNVRVNRLLREAKVILGEEFPVLPRFRYNNPESMQKSLADQKQLLKHICTVQNTNPELALESWIQSTVHVRPDLEKLERVRMLAEALGGKPVNIQAAQTPFRPKDSWLAVEFPELYEPTGKPFHINDETIALTLYGEAFNQTDELQSAFVVDEWPESIPTDKEITGIAYHYNQPNAAPPQALLLAVAPTNAPKWDWKTVMDILDDTLHRAQTRAVEPAQLIEEDKLRHLLPMTIAEFDLQEANPSLDFTVTNDEFLEKGTGGFPLYRAYNRPDPTPVHKP